MTAREYLPPDAPYVVNELFKQPSPKPRSSPQRMMISSQGSSLLDVSSLKSPAPTIGIRKSQRMLFSGSKQLLNTQQNPYLPTSEGLNRFLSAPSGHLTAAGLLKSQADGEDRFTSVTPRREATDINLLTSSRMRIDSTGKRLPSVLKKPVPLPPEDIRSVPHMRLVSRVESPPVVSIGMADLEGIPIPWTKTPEIMSAAFPVATPGVIRTPDVEEVRQSMREDFDNLELFIEQVFGDIVTPSVNELIFEEIA